MTPTVVHVLLLVKGGDLLGNSVLGFSRGVCVIMCVSVLKFPSVIEVGPDDSD